MFAKGEAMNYIKSPLNYSGGKFKLLPQLLPLFPKQINTFVDLFAGGFNVGINVNANKIIYNDICKQVCELMMAFSRSSYNEIHNKILNTVQKYELSRSDINSYEFYGCESNKGLGDYNKDKYFKLRTDYNENPSWDKFYTLVCCSFSNQIRFNKSGGFNMPYGKRDYNSSLQEKLKLFVDELHTKPILEFHNKNFMEFDLESFTQNDLFYCDPPYLNSVASYNENGGWTLENDGRLREVLDKLNDRKIKFALSNDFSYNNTELQEWSQKYNIHYLNHDYSNCNYQKKDKKKSEEVLITNY